MYYFGTGWVPYCASAVFYVIALVRDSVLHFDRLIVYIAL